MQYCFINTANKIKREKAGFREGKEIFKWYFFQKIKIKFEAATAIQPTSLNNKTTKLLKRIFPNYISYL